MDPDDTPVAQGQGLALAVRTGTGTEIGEIDEEGMRPIAVRQADLEAVVEIVISLVAGGTILVQDESQIQGLQVHV